MNAPTRIPTIAQVEPAWTADDLGSVISETFHDCNDVDGPHWPTVARKVAGTIGFALADQKAPRPIDLIYGRVAALGGAVDHNDRGAVAWAKELESVLDFIADLGGRDPHEIDPDWALTAAARHRGQAVAADLYGAL